jgi:tetratricopeptide (TPR) repeat protein
MIEEPSAAPSPVSRRRRRGFWIALFLLPFAFFFSIEGLLRLCRYGGDTKLFVAAESPNDSCLRINPNIGKRYFSRQSTLPLPPNDVFLKQKPEDGCRIFVLGESTTLGFPYGNLLMFPRILQRRIQDTFPARRVEIVNVSLTAVSSYALLDWMDEILEQKPDAILIYAGHNEFYGALGVGSLESAGRIPAVKRLVLKSLRLRWTLLVRDLMRRGAARFAARSGSGDAHASGTLMERIAVARSIPLGSRLVRLAEIQWEGNLRRIFGKARTAGVPVVIGELVSNVRDQAPFLSSDSCAPASADSAFQAARGFEAQARFEEARSAYKKAKDLDLLRFRAPEDFNGIIRRTAGSFGAPCVATWAAFESASPNGLVGDNLMIDHLHPNIDGAFLLADAYYRTLEANRFIGPGWDSPSALPAWAYRKSWPITELDTTIASLMVRQLKNGWPFKPPGTENRFLPDFRPGTPVEDLALRVIFGEMSADRAHFLLARRAEALGEPENAGLDYAVIPRLVFIEAYALLDRAGAFIRAGQPGQALPLLLKSLESEEIPLACRLAGEITLRQGRPDEAIPLLEKALAGNPSHPGLLYDLCLAHFRNGNRAGAEAFYETLRRRFPHSAESAELSGLFESSRPEKP